jgi:hypothetical protein
MTGDPLEPEAWVGVKAGLNDSLEWFSVRNLDASHFLIKIGIATGIRLIPARLLDTYYPGGAQAYLTSQSRPCIECGPLVFKALGPYDPDEFELQNLGFVPGRDFSWLTSSGTPWITAGPDYPLRGKGPHKLVIDTQLIAPSENLRKASPIGTAKWDASIGPPQSKRGLPSAATTTGILDSSLIYGAARILRRVHADALYKYRDQFKKEDDQALFNEFMHLLLLYEKIILDDSSVDEIGDEIKEIIRTVNEGISEPIIETQKIGSQGDAAVVARAICRLINRMPHKHRLLNIRVPWAYTRGSHVDWSLFEDISPDALRPVALFAYRGLCYASFANRLSTSLGKRVVYVAAAGRLAALEPLLDVRDLQRFDFPRREYHDLIDQLELPNEGVDFSFLEHSFEGFEITRLAQQLAGMPPHDALSFVVGMRDYPAVQHIREQWHRRLRALGKPIAVGPVTQGIWDSHISGNVNLYISMQSHDNPMVDNEETAMLSKQTMENIKSAGGKVEQRSNVAVEQLMRNIDASGDVRQLIDIAATNLDVIAAELVKLRAELQRYDPGATAELSRLEKAEAAARAGDSSGVVESLKGAARWVVDFATKVGTSVVAKIIEKQMGF